MYFYKETLDDNSVRYCETTMHRTESNFEEIAPEEYTRILNEMFAQAEEQSNAEQQAQAEAEQSYIEQLEAENAALFYQILTGEEYDD